MNIPDEAIEAAKVAFGGKLPMGFRLALSAAAPILMAQAWDEGVKVGESGWCLLETPCGVCEHCTTPGPANPYRIHLPIKGHYRNEGNQ